MEPGHVRRRARFIQKDQACGIAGRLPGLPGCAGLGHIRTVLFGGSPRLFYSGSPMTAEIGQPRRDVHAHSKRPVPTRVIPPTSCLSVRSAGV
jgi:hypothetical protein